MTYDNVNLADCEKYINAMLLDAFVMQNNTKIRIKYVDLQPVDANSFKYNFIGEANNEPYVTSYSLCSFVNIDNLVDNILSITNKRLYN